MKERRKYKRLPIKLELKISSLFNQENTLIPDTSESINVVNISKAGIGFTCAHELPLNYYFDTKIQLTEDKYFCAVLKIIRMEKHEEGYFLGCEFVGLADILSMRIDLYGEELQNSLK
jgi:c-di-GMP-binding flagellar brake protein YcgR